jgi:prevent-host-death family protein
MSEVTIRELRNRGGDVLDRVSRGETLTVTRDGRPIAELRPLLRQTAAVAVLLERWRRLPHVDPERFRSDIDAFMDADV